MCLTQLHQLHLWKNVRFQSGPEGLEGVWVHSLERFFLIVYNKLLYDFRKCLLTLYFIFGKYKLIY